MSARHLARLGISDVVFRSVWVVILLLSEGVTFAKMPAVVCNTSESEGGDLENPILLFHFVLLWSLEKTDLSQQKIQNCIWL